MPELALLNSASCRRQIVSSRSSYFYSFFGPVGFVLSCCKTPIIVNVTKSVVLPADGDADFVAPEADTLVGDAVDGFVFPFRRRGR